MTLVGQGSQSGPGFLFAAVAILATAVSCSRSDPAPTSVSLDVQGTAASVVVAPLPSTTASALEDGSRTRDQWAEILRVSVGPDAPPIAGDYRVDDDALRFTPAFPFDPGRTYVVRFDASSLGGGPPLLATLTMPGAPPAPSTVVSAVYPSGDVVPENLLRLYIHFSAPMSHSSGIDHVELREADGTVVEGAFLPLDYEFWDADRQRFTVFLDPGRVKRGILPNRQSGRAMKSGRRYTLVVKSTWRDANGVPLESAFTKTYTAGPAAMSGLDASAWKIEPHPVSPSAPAGAVTVSFPQPLDRGLLLRALGIRRDGRDIDGEARVEAGETRWVFTPREPLTPGRYELVALSILEDAAGNQIGKPFEIDNFETVDKSPDPKTIAETFVVGERR